MQHHSSTIEIDYAESDSNGSIINMNKIRSNSLVDGRNKFACICGSSFTRCGDLCYHKNWECGRNLSCKQCNAKFQRKSSLVRHMKKVCKIEFDGKLS